MVSVRFLDHVVVGSWEALTFMTRSGLNWPIPPMAMPDLTVPYAAPTAGELGY